MYAKYKREWTPRDYTSSECGSLPHRCNQVAKSVILICKPCHHARPKTNLAAIIVSLILLHFLMISESIRSDSGICINHPSHSSRLPSIRASSSYIIQLGWRSLLWFVDGLHWDGEGLCLSPRPRVVTDGKIVALAKDCPWNLNLFGIHYSRECKLNCI
jgi:hypothetical protein